MGSFIDYKESNTVLAAQQLHINLQTRVIISSLTIFKFIDKDTKQHVFYLPALDITGYGETTEKANEMMRFSIDDFFKHLISLNYEEIQNELAAFGFKNNVFEKDFSRLFFDLNGQLKDLNAEGNKVEMSTLIAA